MQIQPLKSFIGDESFWWYHGWGMTIAWLVGSFISIALRRTVPGKIGTYLHGFSFLIVNSITLFLAGGALYRTYPNLNKFMEWSLIKQAHIGAGILLTLMIILQHCGGIGLFLNGVGSKTHSSWGTFISVMMRLVVVFGWQLSKKDDKITIGCLIVAIIETILLFRIPKATKKLKEQTQSQQSSTQNTKAQRQDLREEEVYDDRQHDRHNERLSTQAQVSPPPGHDKGNDRANDRGKQRPQQGQRNNKKRE